MTNFGMNASVIKKKNRNAILNFINNNISASRKDISEITGLTPASVTQITNSLIKEGLVREIGVLHEETHRAGRKEILLEINPEYAFIVTINIDVTKTTIALVNFKGSVLSLKNVETDKEKDPAKFFNLLVGYIREMLDSLSQKKRKIVRVVSVGVNGVVDKENGIALSVDDVWDTPVNIREILEKELELPVLIDNNADAYSLAELLFGIGRIFGDLLVVNWDVNLVSSMIIDGKLFNGNNMTKNLGHIVINPDGEKCYCGKTGCLNTVLSHNALCRIKDFPPNEFGATYESSDPETKAKFDDAIKLLARNVTNVGTMLRPEKVVLDGLLFQDEVIRNRFIEFCKEFDSEYDDEKIVFFTLNDRKDYIGLVSVFLNYVLEYV